MTNYLISVVEENGVMVRSVDLTEDELKYGRIPSIWKTDDHDEALDILTAPAPLNKQAHGSLLRKHRGK